jgi:hypothetical protein
MPGLGDGRPLMEKHPFPHPKAERMVIATVSSLWYRRNGEETF